MPRSCAAAPTATVPRWPSPARCAPGSQPAGLPAEAIQLVPTRDRAAVGAMLAGLDGTIDVIVPRGGRSLVARVQAEARVPVFAHLEGICHVYVDGARRSRHGDGDRAQRQDAPHRRLRRGRDAARRPRLRGDASRAARRDAARCRLRGARRRGRRRRSTPRVKPASEADWRTEYLDAIIAVRVVDGLDAAIAHIETYGSHHTDAIVTEDAAAAERFLAEVDSAIVAAQRLDPVRRRRRVRLRRRDRHRHGPHACPRPGRRRAAHHLQVPRARQRPDRGREPFRARACGVAILALPPS